MIATGGYNESIVTYVDYLSKRMEFFKLDFDKDIQAHTVTLTKCKEVHPESCSHIKTAREVSLQFLATLTYMQCKLLDAFANAQTLTRTALKSLQQIVIVRTKCENND